jgi:eukaryotic-like serine/threonine-protein kinase
MSADDALLDTESTDDDELMRLLEACLAEIEAGRAIDLERLTAEHPSLAGRLRACLAGLFAVEEEGATMTRAVAAAAPEATRRRLGDYRLLREVGRGGMGIVYEAEQESLGRRVAVKVLPLAATLDPRQLQRFHNEARAAAGLQHPHIVPVHAVGCEEGVYFYVMRFIDGRTLADWAHPESGTEPTALGSQSGLSAAPQPGPTMDVRTAARLGMQAAEALEHAHQLGVVHRDVKPANLLVDEAGHLWVTDFGLALLWQEDRLTKTGDVVGTLHYMSPEQTSASRGVVDHRTDVYSLGATLYELLTGRPPFEAGFRPELLRQVLEDEPRRLRRLNGAVPADLETIVLKCLAKAPAERYATAQELADDLRRFLDGEAVHAQPPSLVSQLSRWTRRHRTVVGTAAACLLLLIVALAGSLVFVWQEKGRAEQALAGEHLALTGERLALEEKRKALAEVEVARDREEKAAYRDRIDLACREMEDNKPSRVEELLQECRLDLRDWEWRYLRRVSRSASRNLCRPGGFLNSLAFTPDGNLATGGGEATVKIWEARTGALLRTFRVPSGRICQTTFRRDGQGVAVASLVQPTARGKGEKGRWELHLGKLDDGKPDRHLASGEGVPAALEFSPDEQVLALADRDLTVTLWEVATGKELCSLRGPSGSFQALAFAAGGENLAVCRGADVRVYETRTGRELRTLDVPFSPQSRAAFSPQGRSLAVLGPYRLTFVNLATGKAREVLHGRGGSAAALVYSPDGGLLASVGSDRIVRLWNPHLGRELSGFRGHTELATLLAFGPDSRALASAPASSTAAVKLWDAGAGQSARPLPTTPSPRAGVLDLVFLPDNRRLVAAGNDGNVRVWDVQTGTALRSLAHPEPVSNLALGAEGNLATLTPSGTIRIYNLQSGEVVRTLPSPFNAQGLDHFLGQVGLAFSPDGLLVAGSAVDKNPEARAHAVTVWNAATGEAVYSMTGRDTGWGGRVAFSPDGRYLASLADRGRVSIRAAKTGEEALRIAAGQAPLLDLAFSPDSRHLAVADQHGVVSLWEVAPGAASAARPPVWTVRGHQGEGFSVAFSPDGHRLVSTGMDGTVVLWEAGTGRELLTLREHQFPVYRAVFSPDGNKLASSDSGGNILIWDGTPLDDGR